MKTTDKEKVRNALLEQEVMIKVGWRTFRLRPLTLAQIWEMGVFANDIKEAEWGATDRINVLQEMFKHSSDAKSMCEIFIVCAFRKKVWRRFWGGYLRKRLTVMHFNQLLHFMSMSFNANFFLTSITFLGQTKIMTEPTTTARGQQSEE